MGNIPQPAPRWGIFPNLCLLAKVLQKPSSQKKSLFAKKGVDRTHLFHILKGMIITQNLLTSGNTKILKGQKLGYITYGIHFAPANLSGFEVCSARSEGCTLACLNTAGRGRMQGTQDARIAKTILFFKHKQAFLDKLSKEIASKIKSAKKKNMEAVFRLNLTSDLPWERIRCQHDGKTIFEKFPEARFYDYTKVKSRMQAFLMGQKMPENYHLTFSRSEDDRNDYLTQKVLQSGGNVAIVFRNKLPENWNGFEVIDGDDHDLRFLDSSGVVVGLIEKGMAKKDETGFVLEAV